MAHDVETLDLLSAYACGDVTPHEAAAVERLLAQNASARSLLAEIRRLLTKLKAGERAVRPALLSALRQQVQQGTGAIGGVYGNAPLLSASLSGDLDSGEKVALEQHLAHDPRAREELESLRQLQEVLAKGQRPVSAALSDKLAARMSNMLGTAASKPVVYEPEPEAAPSSETRRIFFSQRETLRIYAAQERVWPRRVAWLATGLAALVALAVGLKIAVPGHGTNTVVNNGTSGEGKNTVPPVLPKDARAPLKIEDLAHGNDVPRKPEPRNGFVEAPVGVQNIKPQKKEIAVKNKPDNATQPTEAVIAPQLPKELAPESVKAPKDFAVPERRGPQPTVPFDAPLAVGPIAPPIDSKTPSKNDVAVIPSTGAVQNPSKANTGGVPIPAPNSTPQAPAVAQTPNDNIKTAASDTAITPVDGVAVVAMTADGNVQAQAQGAAAVTLKSRMQVPSGSWITTEQSRAALLLPGWGKLWINRNSRVRFDLIGTSVAITLQSGELSCYAGTNGTLSINAGAGSLSGATAADVRIDSSAITASVLRGNGTFSARNKQVRLGAGSTASVPLAGGNGPALTSVSAAPDAWHGDMNFPGDEQRAISKPTTRRRAIR
ncbi:MAG TPA: FecR domain-containing protein [Planctomycetota bacterium]|jgi:anti-sigma factor RsiW